MKPTIEEVKKVAIECGMNDSVPLLYLAELQAFARHYKEEGRKEQCELDHVTYLEILKIALRDMKAIRDNTGE